jgi:hypothetical protein
MEIRHDKEGQEKEEEMNITRRELIRTAVIGAGATAIGATRMKTALAQDTDRITAQFRADLEKHASFGDKYSGGTGDQKTADWISDRLKQSGYRVREMEFDAPYFVKRTARFAAGSSAVDVVPQGPVVVTGAGGITAPLALAGDPGVDVRGKIALVVLPFGRHAALGTTGIGATVTSTAKVGARATGPSGEAAMLNVPETPFVPIPTAILAPKLSAPFVEAARAGATATLTLDGDAAHRPCRNIIAELNRSDRWIVLTTPRTGWFGCVGERGTGTAVFLELAAWLSTTFPDLSIYVMNAGGHEYNFAGSHRIVASAPDPAKTLAWAHIGATVAARDADESGGKLRMLDTADPQRSLMVTEHARTAAVEGFRGLNGLETPTAVRPGAGELSTFTDRGYTTAFAVIGIHRWFHTVEDTLERTDARLLVPVLRAHQRTIELLVKPGIG